MLSPKARSFVASIRGGGATVTLKLQLTRSSATTAEHDTAVVPAANVVPLAGAQLVATPTPPAATGAG
jgi:hypothetical protein